MRPPDQLLDVHQHLSEALDSLSRALPALPGDAADVARIVRLLTQAQMLLGELTQGIRASLPAAGG